MNDFWKYNGFKFVINDLSVFERSVDLVLVKIKTLLQNGTSQIQEKLVDLQNKLEVMKNYGENEVSANVFSTLQTPTGSNKFTSTTWLRLFLMAPAKMDGIEKEATWMSLKDAKADDVGPITILNPS